MYVYVKSGLMFCWILRPRRPCCHHAFTVRQWRWDDYARAKRWRSVSSHLTDIICHTNIIHPSPPLSNPGGVRFGSAELYDVIDTQFAPNATHSSHAIVDCLAIGQSIQQGTDERVIMFVKLLEGETLTPELEKRIKTEIRNKRSARHVPAKVSGRRW